MKIVDYDTFIKMPAGTLYAEYTPCVFGETLIKQNTLNEGKDWLYLELVGNPDTDSEWSAGCEAMEKGEDLPPDTSLCRDGMFDYSRRFLVYNRDDVENMIETLKESLK
jgi:hypothetical protein